MEDISVGVALEYLRMRIENNVDLTAAISTYVIPCAEAGYRMSFVRPEQRRLRACARCEPVATESVFTAVDSPPHIFHSCTPEPCARKALPSVWGSLRSTWRQSCAN